MKIEEIFKMAEKGGNFLCETTDEENRLLKIEYGNGTFIVTAYNDGVGDTIGVGVSVKDLLNFLKEGCLLDWTQFDYEVVQNED